MVDIIHRKNFEMLQVIQRRNDGDDATEIDREVLEEMKPLTGYYYKTIDKKCHQ